MAETETRGTWGSRLALIMAAAGSAIGLGNIWGFPTRVGQGGGAAFVVIYLLCIFFICAPVMIAELALGRASGSSPVGAFERFRPGSKWWLVGTLGVVSGVAIVSFYSVVGGWTLAYIGLAATNGLEGNLGERFGSVISKGGMNIGLTFAFIALAAASNVGGVRRGIERVTKILMPILIGLLLLLLRPQPHAAPELRKGSLITSILTSAKPSTPASSPRRSARPFSRSASETAA